MANTEVRRKGRILVADDDQSILKLLSIYLESSGYEVIRAVDGREALGLIQALEPDLAILDVLMPVMSGYEVCTILRDQPNTAAMPLILLSALNEVTDKVQGLRFGADEYITKPVALPELGARVEALLRRAKQLQPVQPSQRGKVFAFMGVKGGVGTTTVVLNVSAALMQLKNTVLALELHPSYGTFSHQLQLAPAPNLASLLSLDADRINEREVKSRLFNAASALSVLPGPQRVDEFKEPTAGQAEAIVRHASLLADCVLIDLPSKPSDASEAAVKCCDYMILVLEPDATCVRCAKVMLELVRSWGVNPGQVGAVIVIQGRSASTLSVNELKSQLGCNIVGVVPAAAEGLIAAQAHAAPLVLHLPKHWVTTPLTEIARHLAAPTLTGIRQ